MEYLPKSMVVQLSIMKALYHMVGIYKGYYMSPIVCFASLGTIDKCYVAGITVGDLVLDTS